MSYASTFFDIPAPVQKLSGDRDGETFNRKRDLVRLNEQQLRIYDVMKDGRWHTLRDVSDATGDPETSVSARLRDLRKPKFGGFTVEREHVIGGLWRYRMVMP
jgi:hypothetical protein